MRDLKINGTLSLEPIQYNRVLERIVRKQGNNSSSACVNVPLDLVGKTVYVIVQEG